MILREIASQMNQKRTIMLLFLLTIVGLMGIMFAWDVNYRYIVNHPKTSGFVVGWTATRMFMLHGWSPYSDDTSNEIAKTMAEYLHSEIDDPFYFVYPFYAMLMFAPFALIHDLPVALTAWMLFLEVCFIVVIFLNFLLNHWRPNRWMILAVVIFSVLWFHSVKPLINFDISIIVLVLISLGLFLLSNRMDSLAGLMFAMATIKPQLSILLIVYVLLWSVIKKRWKVIFGFIGSLFLLFLISGVFYPDWLLQNIRQIYVYAEAKTLITSWLVLKNWLPGIGSQLGWLLTSAMLLLLAIEWIRSFGSNFNYFLWGFFTTIVVTYLIGIYATLDDFVLLYLALFFVFSVWDTRWKGRGRVVIITYMVVLVGGLWSILIYSSRHGLLIEFSPIVFFYTPFMTLIALYWVMWWAIKYHELPYNELIDHYQ